MEFVCFSPLPYRKTGEGPYSPQHFADLSYELADDTPTMKSGLCEASSGGY